jgi:hypothetical protein
LQPSLLFFFFPSSKKKICLQEHITVRFAAIFGWLSIHLRGHSTPGRHGADILSAYFLVFFFSPRKFDFVRLFPRDRPFPVTNPFPDFFPVTGHFLEIFP